MGGADHGPHSQRAWPGAGGANSSEFYKLYNNEQLVTANNSGLGATISGIAVASVGQADDTALVSHDIHQLQLLLNLSLIYCEKHQVQLSAGKTKLLVFSKQETNYVKYAKLLSPLHIGKTTIPFASTAEHVGILRSVTGNLPHIHQRIVKHKRSLAGILCMGLSKRHRANPIAALRAESIFSTPILFSGMASLYLTKSESDMLAQHVKENTEQLLKLHPKTPIPVVFFLAGRLPGEALLHQKQLTLFGMICQLQGNILHNIALQLLTTAKQTSKHWFADIRALCFTYNLPHPLVLLKNPLGKEKFKLLIKNNITDYWQTKLRSHSATLENKSLKYFKPHYMSLTKPHAMYLHAVTSYQVNKCVTVARMLSGRFRCGSLLRHFYPQKVSGVCELCTLEIEDIPHIILPKCPLLYDKAESLLKFAQDTLSVCPSATNIFSNIFTHGKDDYLKVQFMLDPTVIPEVIRAAQINTNIIQIILRVTTTWSYSLNKTRKKLLERKELINSIPT